MDRRWTRRPWRNALATLATLAVLAAWSGLLPIALRPRSAERFPCEACGCGCASAHECWTSCCCFSPVERVAWALRNDVPIPAWVRVDPKTLAAARDATHDRCPLCDRDDSKARDEPASLNLLAAKRCKRQSIGGAVPTIILSLAPASMWWLTAPDTAFPAPPVDVRPASRSIDAPEPPPRA